MKIAKTVHPNYEIMGWYATGKSISEQDHSMYHQLLPYNESPLFLLLDTSPDPNARDIPMFIYDTENNIINGESKILFSKKTYKVETSDSERLTVDHLARYTGTSESGSQLRYHLESIKRAIKMLNLRIGIIVQYLHATAEKKLDVDLTILRRVSSLCSMLPAIDGPFFKQDFLNENNDALMLTYMSSIIKASITVNQFIENFNLAYDKNSRNGIY